MHIFEVFDRFLNSRKQLHNQRIVVQQIVGDLLRKPSPEVSTSGHEHILEAKHHMSELGTDLAKLVYALKKARPDDYIQHCGRKELEDLHDLIDLGVKGLLTFGLASVCLTDSQILGFLALISGIGAIYLTIRTLHFAGKIGLRQFVAKNIFRGITATSQDFSDLTSEISQLATEFAKGSMKGRAKNILAQLKSWFDDETLTELIREFEKSFQSTKQDLQTVSKNVSLDLPSIAHQVGKSIGKILELAIARKRLVMLTHSDRELQITLRTSLFEATEEIVASLPFKKVYLGKQLGDIDETLAEAELSRTDTELSRTNFSDVSSETTLDASFNFIQGLNSKRQVKQLALDLVLNAESLLMESPRKSFILGLASEFVEGFEDLDSLINATKGEALYHFVHSYLTSRFKMPKSQSDDQKAKAREILEELSREITDQIREVIVTRIGDQSSNTTLMSDILLSSSNTSSYQGVIHLGDSSR